MTMSRAQMAHQRRMAGATIQEIMDEFQWTRSSAMSLLSRGKNWATWSAKHTRRADLAERNRKICADVLAGMKYADTAVKYNLSVQSIKLIASKAGVKSPNPSGRRPKDRVLLARNCDLAAFEVFWGLGCCEYENGALDENRWPGQMTKKKRCAD